MTTGTDWIDQAQRLVETLRGSLASAVPGAEERTEDRANGGAIGEGHGSDCRWCPVCQVAAVVRGERPEITTALADVLAAAATALRTIAAAGQPEPPSTTGAPEERTERPPVQRIDIA